MKKTELVAKLSKAGVKVVNNKVKVKDAKAFLAKHVQASENVEVLLADWNGQMRVYAISSEHLKHFVSLVMVAEEDNTKPLYKVIKDKAVWDYFFANSKCINNDADDDDGDVFIDFHNTKESVEDLETY